MGMWLRDTGQTTYRDEVSNVALRYVNVVAIAGLTLITYEIMYILVPFKLVSRERPHLFASR